MSRNMDHIFFNTKMGKQVRHKPITVDIVDLLSISISSVQKGIDMPIN